MAIENYMSDNEYPADIQALLGTMRDGGNGSEAEALEGDIRRRGKQVFSELRKLTRREVAVLQTPCPTPEQRTLPLASTFHLDPSPGTLPLEW